MKIPYSTLQHYIPELDITPEQIGELLSLKSYEVESVYNPQVQLKSIIVGIITDIQPHPNADKLQITQVSVGQPTQLTIVCGAKNIAIGQKVPIAPVGATLPNGLVIQVANLRGQESFGMICSAKELGLDFQGDGVLVLPSNAQEGDSIVHALGLDEIIIEIDNKGLGTRASDSSSLYGVAREVAMLIDKPLKNLESVDISSHTKLHTDIHIKTDKCSYYSLMKISGLSQYRFDSNVLSKGGYRVDLYVQTEKFTLDPRIIHTLRTLGVSIHHPAVDLGNYIMLETGQPVHIFDTEKVKGGITVREAEDGEIMIGLNGEEITLEKGDIVICDTEKIIALAGIIGSKDSAVDDGTTSILVESAHFDALQIRKTARRLKLLTDSAKRFEKLLPVELVDIAMQRIAYITQESGLKIEGHTHKGHHAQTQQSVSMTFDYIRKYIGVNISDETITHILKKLDISTHKSFGSEVYKLTAPYWRLDLTTPEEYIEEVARLYGYDIIPAKIDFGILSVNHHPVFQLKRSITQAMVARGYTEIITYPYTKTETDIQMVNPVDASKPYLRTSLIESMSEAIVSNQPYQEKLALFEVSHIFNETQDMHIGIGYWDKYISAKNAVNILYQDILSVLSQLSINIVPISYQVDNLQIQLMYQDTSIGIIDTSQAIAEINLTQLQSICQYTQEVYRSIPRYPSVKRDITIKAPISISAQEVYQKIQQLVSPRCEYIGLKDTFSENNLMHYTFRLEFRDMDKSLTDDEVNQEIHQIETQLVY